MSELVSSGFSAHSAQALTMARSSLPHWIRIVTIDQRKRRVEVSRA
jgi:hypothetical protein